MRRSAEDHAVTLASGFLFQVHSEGSIASLPHIYIYIYICRHKYVHWKYQIKHCFWIASMSKVQLGWFAAAKLLMPFLCTAPYLPCVVT